MLDLSTSRTEHSSKDGKRLSRRLKSRPVKVVIDEALKVSTPSWPLQNTVAVNPFWFQRGVRYEDVITGLYHVAHRDLHMPVEHYLSQYSNGHIPESSIEAALKRLRSVHDTLPTQVEEFIRVSKGEAVSRRKFQSFSDFLDERLGTNIAKLLSGEVSRYAAAYLDTRQALARFPWQNLDFLNAWLEASALDRSLEAAGAGSLPAVTKRLTSRTADGVISEIFSEIGIHDADAQRLILERLAFGVLGWMSQFRYVEWQKGLGYTLGSKAEAADLLAVRLAYEFAYLESMKASHGAEIEEWRAQAIDFLSQSPGTSKSIPVEVVWQAALEDSYQRRVSNSLNLAPTERKSAEAAVRGIDAQLAFCIDVRSEMIRRHIEATDQKLATIGFAGFFGVALDYKRIDENEVGHRCPVLLTPALHVDETAKGKSEAAIERKVTRKLTLSYFKALRKAPLSSFAYVEMLGILALRPMLSRTWKAMVGTKSPESVPARFACTTYAPDVGTCTQMGGGSFEGDERSARAAGILKHMGLRSGFAPVVVIAGHGSHTTNNAFGSALDCGACGGHAGDVNARVVVGLLNDKDVRAGFGRHGVNVPEETHFVAAVHETVTDEVYLLDEETIPSKHRPTCERLKQTLRVAAASARTERQSARSRFVTGEAATRAENWSEVRPEWALAGNACFIVAPRSRTRGVNLGSRSFLHDYDFRQDEGYATLELIMTAPMVVTNWINMQYFASTVAPDIYGAGNKVLHNVVNESGVVEGNGGDLRVGLPIQSVHDGATFVHEPLRLSVFIEAPREALEEIIAKHQVVRELLDNEWLYLLQINREDGVVSARRPGGVYEVIESGSWPVFVAERA